jgi:hypothetical protein
MVKQIPHRVVQYEKPYSFPRLESEKAQIQRRKNLHPKGKPTLKNIKKPLFALLAVVAALAAVWFGTVRIQKPPLYPTAQKDLEEYFDDFRMGQSMPREGLLEDVDALVAYTDEMHADPYRVTGRSAFLDKAEEIKGGIRTDESESVPVQKAFYYLQELAAGLQDGHTSLYPLNWERTVGTVFPLALTSVEGRLFVQRNYGGNGIPERAELLAVNGVPVNRMTEGVMKYLPATLPHFRRTVCADYLPMLMQTYFQMPSPWKITYSANGTITTVPVDGIDSESFLRASVPEKDYRESETRIHGETVPVLELTGFENGSWDDFKAFVDGFFTRHRDNRHLVIDVRHHPGGDGDWGYYVLSHLTSATLKGYKEFTFKVSPLHQEIVRYSFQSVYYENKLPQFLWGFPLYQLSAQDDPYYWIGRGILESKPGDWYFAKFADSKSYFADETAPRFQGKIFLLTSHETFSAGVVFSELFRSNNLGVIVGRETGGRVYMESDQRPVMLPHSNLPYLIPVAKLIVGDDNPDRGVIPDYAVELTAEDYTGGRDKDMEKVSELIAAGR